MWFLPILCWLLTVTYLARRGCEWRSAFLLAGISWGCLVAVFTELLSVIRRLTADNLALCWTIAIGVALLLNFSLKKPWKARKVIIAPTALEVGLLGGVVLVCLATFVTAILAPPNTWDSMTYHMSRVMHWLQNRSVDHYPTHILRQIELNPWAEFAIAHFQALSGGDRFANLVQWFSMVGSMVGVSLVTEQIGGDWRAQLFAAIVTATIPMGILQASSTQNDYVVSFWLVCLTWAGLQSMVKKELKWAAIVGASLGLAILTKGTAYLFALPFMGWVILTICHGVTRKAIVYSAFIILPVLLLNSPHYCRNNNTFSNPLSSGSDRYVNEEISLRVLASNVLRNTALQMATRSEQINSAIMDGVYRIHNILGIDVNDKTTTFEEEKFNINKMSIDEDNTNNILHFLFYVLVVFTSIHAIGKINITAIRYLLVFTMSFFVFCLVLKWQPWHSRLLLPLFVLISPVACYLSCLCWKPMVVTVTVLMLMLASTPWAFCNSTRPLVMRLSMLEMGMFPLFKMDRNQFYFVRAPYLYGKYENISDEIKGKMVKNIGLITGEDTMEYPLWVLINQKSTLPFRIEHVDVKNKSGIIHSTDFKPEYIIDIE